MAKRKRRAFIEEFKAQAVRVVRESGKSVGTVAQELDLTETPLRSWVRQAAVDAGHGPAGALTTNECEELGRLSREVRTSRMERDIIKSQSAVPPVRRETPDAAMLIGAPEAMAVQLSNRGPPSLRRKTRPGTRNFPLGKPLTEPFQKRSVAIRVFSDQNLGRGVNVVLQRLGIERAHTG